MPRLYPKDFANSSYSDQLFNSNNTIYQPNFVLISTAQDASINSSIFGDIIPFYNNSGTELSSVIVSTWESLSNMIMLSNVVWVSTMSIFSQAMDSVIYQSYLVLMSSLEQIYALPDRYNAAKKSIEEIIETLSSKQNRELWWLGIKLDYRELVKKITIAIHTSSQILKKFYLSAIVVAMLGMLSILSPQTSNSLENSFLTRFFNNYSYNYSHNPQSTQVLGVNTAISTYADVERTPKVSKHKVQEGENIELISVMYGLTPSTITFNNAIANEEKLPSEIVLPWKDGYIYSSKEETSPEKLEEIYKVDKNKIYQENEDIIDEKGVFPKDSLILIPTTDFATISKINEQQKATTESKKNNVDTTKKLYNNNSNNTNKTTYINATSGSPRSKGFIWPAVGSISRCLDGGHVACDIANNSLPPIFAVQDGVISDVYRFTVYGYGLAVVIDHGNGLKTLYAHMSEIYVAPGQRVSQGQSIGRMGCTGRCTGPHVHFEVRINGNKVNPRPYLP